ncbi:MAG: adenosylhomocysteinase [Candidatus Thorarchaeota archaeon]
MNIITFEVGTKLLLSRYIKPLQTRDISLKEEGLKTMEWAASRMPVLQLIKKRFKEEKPFKGVRIGACLHVTKETLQLCEAWLAHVSPTFNKQIFSSINNTFMYSESFRSILILFEPPRELKI